MEEGFSAAAACSSLAKNAAQSVTCGFLRRSARRWRSVSPPHTPNSTRFSNASTRQRMSTGQSLQIAAAFRCSAPCTKSASGSISLHSARMTHSPRVAGVFVFCTGAGAGVRPKGFLVRSRINEVVMESSSRCGNRRANRAQPRRKTALARATQPKPGSAKGSVSGRPSAHTVAHSVLRLHTRLDHTFDVSLFTRHWARRISHTLGSNVSQITQHPTRQRALQAGKMTAERPLAPGTPGFFEVQWPPLIAGGKTVKAPMYTPQADTPRGPCTLPASDCGSTDYGSPRLSDSWWALRTALRCSSREDSRPQATAKRRQPPHTGDGQHCAKGPATLRLHPRRAERRNTDRRGTERGVLNASLKFSMSGDKPTPAPPGRRSPGSANSMTGVLKAARLPRNRDS